MAKAPEVQEGRNSKSCRRQPTGNKNRMDLVLGPLYVPVELHFPRTAEVIRRFGIGRRRLGMKSYPESYPRGAVYILRAYVGTDAGSQQPEGPAEPRHLVRVKPSAVRATALDYDVLVSPVASAARARMSTRKAMTSRQRRSGAAVSSRFLVGRIRASQQRPHPSIPMNSEQGSEPIRPITRRRGRAASSPAGTPRSPARIPPASCAPRVPGGRRRGEPWRRHRTGPPTSWGGPAPGPPSR